MRSHAEIDHPQAIRGENISRSLCMNRTDRAKQLYSVFPVLLGLWISPWISVALGQQLPSETLPAPTSKKDDSSHASRAGDQAETLTLDALDRHWKSHRLIDAVVEPIRLAPSDAANSMENFQEFATNPVAFAQLRFEPELPADVLVRGPTLATFTGGKSAEWRIGVEGKSTGLRVLVTSKPGADWQFTTRVLLDSLDAGAGVTRVGSGTTAGLEIQPKTVVEVLKRLQTYDRWLLESSEEWKSLSAAQRGRDAIDALSKSRLLGIRQKESERSLRRWLEIEALAKPLFERGYLDLFVHAKGPSNHGEPQSTSDAQSIRDSANSKSANSKSADRNSVDEVEPAKNQR
jgi:hypothetical protein